MYVLNLHTVQAADSQELAQIMSASFQRALPEKGGFCRVQVTNANVMMTSLRRRWQQRLSWATGMSKRLQAEVI